MLQLDPLPWRPLLADALDILEVFEPDEEVLGLVEVGRGGVELFGEGLERRLHLLYRRERDSSVKRQL